MEYADKTEKLRAMIEQSENIVFFGGAGVSTESEGGLYSQQYKYPPEFMLSHTFYASHADEFFDFYRNKILCPRAKPNEAHRVLHRLEEQGKLKAVITQNIDGLHQAAGSKNVLELHGSVHRNYCVNCGRFYPLHYILGTEEIPRCECGGVVKPDVVLYEEGLDPDTLEKAARFIKEADLLIVGGTSLVVYPAAGLLQEYRGGKLVLINKGTTPYDNEAALVIGAKVGETLGKAWPSGQKEG
jgi:NAD-dependent deacetylase